MRLCGVRYRVESQTGIIICRTSIPAILCAMAIWFCVDQSITVCRLTRLLLSRGAFIYTKGKVGFSDGRLDIRAKLYGATGAWPAFWLLPENEGWPNGGEIDIMERLNNDTIAYQTVHSAYTYTLGIKDNPKQGGIGFINRDDYNVYSVEMYQDSLVFFINETRTFAYPRIETDKEGQFPFTDKKFYLLLDMQLGGSWVGAVDSSDLPVEMEIDWVRFYQKKK